jgi:hypothetical protein
MFLGDRFSEQFIFETDGHLVQKKLILVNDDSQHPGIENLPHCPHSVDDLGLWEKSLYRIGGFLSSKPDERS